MPGFLERFYHDLQSHVMEEVVPSPPQACLADEVGIKGVTANSLRNLAEIGNQPVDGTRRDLRWSLGGRGRVPRGTVPGGLYPHSEVRSGGLGCHDDHSRLLGQAHSRVEQAHQPVLHHPDNSHGATVGRSKGSLLILGANCE